jgi:hypothetical protein
VRTAEAVGHPEWANDPKYATAKARQSHIFEIFADVEKFLADKTKYEAVDHFSKFRGAELAGAVHEGTQARRIPAERRDRRRGTAQGARLALDRRMPDEVFGLAQAEGIRFISDEQSAGNAAAIAGYLTKKPGSLPDRFCARLSERSGGTGEYYHQRLPHDPDQRLERAPHHRSPTRRL